jgi:hypothetical protein
MVCTASPTSQRCARWYSPFPLLPGLTRTAAPPAPQIQNFEDDEVLFHYCGNPDVVRIASGVYAYDIYPLQCPGMQSGGVLG